MNLIISIVTITSTIITVGYSIFIPNFKNEKSYFQTLFADNTIVNKYLISLGKILDLFTLHLGKPFSEQTYRLTTNLAVFYSFAVFLLIYFFTGYGNLGTLEILNGDLSKSLRFFLLLLSSLYFWFLYSNYRIVKNNTGSNIPILKKVLLITITLLSSFFISIILSVEWNDIYHFDINTKSVAIILLSITLSAAILGFSGDSRGSKEGFGSLVFIVTFLSLVGISSVLSIFLQFEKFGIYSFVSLLVLISLCLTTIYLWKKKYNIYYFNIAVVGLYVVIKNFIPSIFGMDIISSTLLYFFVALPFINGSLDFISLSISRILAISITRRGKISTLITHVIFDFFIAFVLLCVLILVFVFVTKLFNYLLSAGTGFYIPIKEIFDYAINNPLSPTGLWLYAMMFSTLLPTFAHLFIGISALVFHYPFEIIRKSITNILSKKQLDTDDKIKLILFVAIDRFGSIAIIVLIMFLLIENTGPYFMAWIKELSNIILST